MTIQRLTVFAIIYKKTTDGKRFLVTKSFLSHYTFLGGGIKKGENPKEALLREIKEETRVEPSNIMKIIPLSFYGKNSLRLILITIESSACFFIIELKKDTKLVSNWEIRQTLWLKENEAMRVLSFSSSKQALGRAIELIKSWEK